MDITSYLLGKQAGGGGSSDLDWKALGYNKVPEFLQEAYNYALEIKNNFVPQSDLSNKYEDKGTKFRFMPLIDTSMATSMEGMFNSNNELVYIPVLNTSKVTTMDYMVENNYNLSYETINNILEMCINAKLYASTKTLIALGFVKNYYSKSRIQNLPNYQRFINAGWTIGY